MMITLTCSNCGKDRSFRKLPIPECPHCGTPYAEESLRDAMAKLKPRSIRWAANLTIGGLVAGTLFLAAGTIDFAKNPGSYFEQPAEMSMVAQTVPNTANEPAEAAGSTTLMLAGLGFLLMMVMLLFSPFLFIAWFYLAYRNLERAGFDGLEYSPWAPLWVFFVPFLNMFRPYQIMQELWQGSHALARGEYAGRAWQDQGNSKLVKFWWASFLLAGLGVTVADTVFVGTTTASSLTLMSFLLIIVAGVLAIAMIRTITDLQEAARTAEVIA